MNQAISHVKVMNKFAILINACNFSYRQEQTVYSKVFIHIKSV